MKTLFNTVLKASFIAVLLSASLFSMTAAAATFNMEEGPVTTDIKKVVVTGNTNVIIIQNDSESVNVDEFDLAQVSLTKIGNTLTISSSTHKPVTVLVYVKDIYRIDASNNATVSTSGKFNVKNLQVMLRDSASARVKVRTESLYTVVKDHATLDLKGASATHIYKIDGLAKIDTNKFAAAKSEDVNQPLLVNGAAAQAVAIVIH